MPDHPQPSDEACRGLRGSPAVPHPAAAPELRCRELPGSVSWDSPNKGPQIWWLKTAGISLSLWRPEVKNPRVHP